MSIGDRSPYGPPRPPVPPPPSFPPPSPPPVPRRPGPRILARTARLTCLGLLCLPALYVLSGLLGGSSVLVPMVLALVGLVAQYVLSTMAAAKVREVFTFSVTRHDLVRDPVVLRIQRLRAGTALVASLLILTLYGTGEDWKEAMDQALLRTLLTPWLLLPSAGVVIAVFFRVVAPAQRPAMRARLREPLRAVLWFFGALTVMATSTMVLRAVLEPAGMTHLTMALALVAALPALWSFTFVVRAVPRVFRTHFNIPSVHPALPAVLTGVLVWEFAVINLVSSGMPPGPPLIRFCALLGGPVSVTAVAWWELNRLRTHHGVTIRE